MTRTKKVKVSFKQKLTFKTHKLVKIAVITAVLLTGISGTGYAFYAQTVEVASSGGDSSTSASAGIDVSIPSKAPTTSSEQGPTITPSSTRDLNATGTSISYNKATAAAARAAKQQKQSAAKGSISNAAQTNNGLRGKKLYVDPSYRQMGRPAAIADQSVARWFGGWNANIRNDINDYVSAATQQNALATIILYNIPVRDCGSYSAGGASSSASYRNWIQQAVAGIGNREAIVIVEPDALPGLDCLNPSDQATRLADISFAVSSLASQTKAFTYIDAGNYSWKSADTMATRLRQANVAQARGFSLNVSGFGWTRDTTNYGASLAQKLGSKNFVIDTSRNGNGPAAGNDWCNPSGRALGDRPTTSPSEAYLDAKLWMKVPGESDGTCNGGPSAGVWWPAYADSLIRS